MLVCSPTPSEWPANRASEPPLCTAPPFGSVVSRKQLAAQAAVAKRLAAAASRGGYGVPEASLREAQRQLAEAGEAGDYSRIFTPEEVADILAGAPPLPLGCACACTELFVLGAGAGVAGASGGLGDGEL